MAPRSRATSRLFLSPSGTSPATMRWASPSTMAVLPTPGSPISTGLFLVRRESTWMTRRISSSRPMTGSSLPLRASSVRSLASIAASAWYFSSGLGSVTRWVPRTSTSALVDRRPASRPPRPGARRAGAAASPGRWRSAGARWRRTRPSAARPRRGARSITRLEARRGVLPPAAAADLGQLVHLRLDLARERLRARAELAEERADHALLLLERARAAGARARWPGGCPGRPATARPGSPPGP